MKITFALSVFVVAMALSSCGSSSSPTLSCNTALSGTPWTPSISGVSTSNYNANVNVTTTTQSVSGPVIGLGDPPSGAKQVSVQFTVPSDPGLFGSVTLVGLVSGYPGNSGLSGGAYPMLVSLTDSSGNDYVGLNSMCFSSGLYDCSTGTCIQNGCSLQNNSVVCTSSSRCDIDRLDNPSMYVNFTHWEQHQAPNQSGSNTPSTNMLPNCNWAGGNNPSSSTDTAFLTDPSCPFSSSNLFDSNSHMKAGTYTAKYVMVADSYGSLSGQTINGTLKVTIISRTNTVNTTVGGATDLNIIMVGNNVINQSRTAKGQQNLNTLITDVSNIYQASTPNIKFGQVNSIEWQCNTNSTVTSGDTYGPLLVSQMPAMFAQSGNLVAAAEQGRSFNVFLVDSITDDTGSIGSGYTILGFDGAIGGPPITGTSVSGVTVSTFDGLATYNPNCPSTGVCPQNTEDTDFHEMGIAIAHEVGHYFGLNHPSEASGTVHDMLTDTPICTSIDSQTDTITINSCLNDQTMACYHSCTGYNANTGVYCATDVDCQFNYVMWWTAKDFTESSGTGDGNIFSADSGILINYNPQIR
jgi:hypothetical protein